MSETVPGHLVGPARPMPRLGDGWSDLAVRSGLLVARLSRSLGLGDGSNIGGRVSLALHPGALRRLAGGRRVVLVSGTNGKTTTSHLLAEALGTLGEVAHNASGSNMAEGVAAALATARGADRAVLEVDELHLARVARQSHPVLIVLLNLTRDQLDRVAEVRRTAAAIGRALAELPHTTVLANVDDPMTVWAAGHAAGPVVWAAADTGWRADSMTCPRCGRPLAERRSAWRCSCGLARPEPDWRLASSVAIGQDSATPLTLNLPGPVNRANALMALAAARHEGVEPVQAAAAMGRVEQVAGRYAVFDLGPHRLRLLLAKNPAGWAATLGMLRPGRPLVVAVNAREADGRDTSWLWDVDFGALAGRPVVASGERAADIGVRLSYADLPHRTEADPLAAVAGLPAGEVDVVANYTAFFTLRRRLAARA